jgi:lysophospholipase L1-like esterase
MGLLVVETKLARRWIGEPTAQPPRADGLYGADHPGEPLRLCMIGDSSAAGLGVHEPEHTPGAMLATGLAEAAGRPVRLTNVAFTGAQSASLEAQVDEALAADPDVAVVMVGANDVTHRVRPSTSVRLLDMAVRRLCGAGVQVVVGTCPDLGTVEPIAQPLRYIARRWSRQLAAAQTIAVVEAGARTVSLGDILGPEFAAAPSEMFGPDRFHPSVAGYRACAMSLLPSVCTAIGLWPDVEAPDARRGEGVRSVAAAAAEAAEQAGTEVAPTDVAGRERGPWGRWALLRHRRRRQLPAVEPPVDDSGAAAPLVGDRTGDEDVLDGSSTDPSGAT